MSSVVYIGVRETIYDKIESCWTDFIKMKTQEHPGKWIFTAECHKNPDPKLQVEGLEYYHILRTNLNNNEEEESDMLSVSDTYLFIVNPEYRAWRFSAWTMKIDWKTVFLIESPDESELEPPFTIYI